MQFPSRGWRSSQPFLRARRRSFSSSAREREVVVLSSDVEGRRWGRLQRNVDELTFMM